ncbi:multisubunit Na+/H+ antiporter MnhG subunit [Streptosporangium album]|uniref:Multisubunit Na+/H+ antiporter MnhG subunit n=1 Tax=Streptosporangium album TaxID=47479 RepID=A0A7W7RQ54_9ACTN|nr:hypothetical protein [Streptosporangium album]MBB4935857.1 multisubunit Na+/H+ antiporter MnhG subunit [Streptosporangium album]
MEPLLILHAAAAVCAPALALLMTFLVTGVGALVLLYQVVTATVAAYMVGRAAYRSGSPDDDGTAVPPLGPHA